jgi:hypothetical protein
MSDLLGDPVHTRQTRANLPAATYPHLSLPGDVKTEAVAAEWIASFKKFLQNKDLCPPRDIFFEESYWRDHLCFSWDFHTWHGPEKMSSFLRDLQRGCQFRQVSVDSSDPDKSPKLVPIDHNGNVHGMQVYIDIETDAGTGKGLVRLLHEAGSQKWKAFTVYTALFELGGHAEMVKHRRRQGFIYKLPGTTTGFDNWQKMRIAQKNFEANLQPTVLVIGKAIQQRLFSSLQYQNTWPRS